MSDKFPISRRAFAGGALLLALGRSARWRRALPGLAWTATDLQPVIPGKIFRFPADLGPHPDYRIEWWYVTANLMDSTGAAYGAQWTLFRQAIAARRASRKAGPTSRSGWAMPP